MNYSVMWRQAALQSLAAIWNAATDRNAITAASHAIDTALAVSPHTVGT